MNKFKSLTLNQILSLTTGKKHWSEKIKHLTNIAKNYGIVCENEEDMKYLIEVHCPNEFKRLKKERFRKSQTGEIKTKYTPTDIKGDFNIVENPTIGRKYHISWAFSGAVFVLKEIKNDVCYLDNPRHKRKKLLTCKTSELRHLR